HGEPGVRRIPIEPASKLVNRLLAAILAEVPRGPVVLLVNNLGGTPTMELAIVAGYALDLIEQVGGYCVERVYCGTFLSALEMAGVSLSMMPVDDAMLARLDAPTDALAWPAVPRKRPWRTAPLPLPVQPAERVARPPQTERGQRLEAALRVAC